ncbi:hypothetical protein BJ138DRAFT_1142629 [Hygrophoropsis aurantiaca]|uniref:Uncharacterized protein n=1 Tax=Hygrophoropsis aurantiaca TaxID=72124 RepID=A0ACB8AQ92_9AGAM|nr:hypothetical protein BJ138DRAFT_1142629 [Hygrophoropsis aurantiaca]
MLGTHRSTLFRLLLSPSYVYTLPVILARRRLTVDMRLHHDVTFSNVLLFRQKVARPAFAECVRTLTTVDRVPALSF